MLKPTFVYQFVLSIVLASCTKAEFVKITDARAPDGSGGSRADVTPPGLQCEDKASTVCVKSYPDTTVSTDCPAVCHTTAGQPAKTGEVCDPKDGYDNCAPGNVCLAIANGNATHICFQLCVDSTWCVNVACAARSFGNTTWVKVCDLGYASCSTPTGCCDPLTPYSGKCGAGMVCYLVAPLSPLSQDSRTVCEYASGDGNAEAFCGTSRDCVPNYACFFPSTSPTGKCKLVCDPKDSSPTACPCTAYNNQYGLCL